MNPLPVVLPPPAIAIVPRVTYMSPVMVSLLPVIENAHSRGWTCTAPLTTVCQPAWSLPVTMNRACRGHGVDAGVKVLPLEETLTEEAKNV
jgi:hypothetical protein